MCVCNFSPILLYIYSQNPISSRVYVYIVCGAGGSPSQLSLTRGRARLMHLHKSSAADVRRECRLIWVESAGGGSPLSLSRAAPAHTMQQDACGASPYIKLLAARSRGSKLLTHSLNSEYVLSLSLSWATAVTKRKSMPNIEFFNMYIIYITSSRTPQRGNLANIPAMCSCILILAARGKWRTCDAGGKYQLTICER